MAVPTAKTTAASRTPAASQSPCGIAARSRPAPPDGDADDHLNRKPGQHEDGHQQRRPVGALLADPRPARRTCASSLIGSPPGGFAAVVGDRVDQAGWCEANSTAPPAAFSSSSRPISQSTPCPSSRCSGSSEHQQRSGADEPGGQRQPASLPGGQGARQLLALLGQPDLGHQRPHHRVGVRDVVRRGQQTQVLLDAEVRERSRCCRPPRRSRRGATGSLSRSGLPVQGDRPAVGSLAAQDALQQRALSGAVRADDGHRLAGLDLEAQAVQHLVVAEAAQQRRHPQQWLRTATGLPVAGHSPDPFQGRSCQSLVGSR